jgi:hypothetical protein
MVSSLSGFELSFAKSAPPVSISGFELERAKFPAGVKILKSIQSFAFNFK